MLGGPRKLEHNVRRHGGAIHAVPVCQLADCRAVEVVVNEAVGGGAGLGLSLARAMAVELGGRLVLASRQPTTFTVFLKEHLPTSTT